jgi:prepilin peptidase CpaA
MEYTMLFVFPLVMLLAGAMDLLTMTIPNRICIVLAALFVLAAPLSGMPTAQIFEHTLTGLGILAVCIAMFSRGWMGGGDAKLLSAAALWVGYSHMMDFVFYVTIAGGALSLAVLLYRKIPAVYCYSLPAWAERLHTPGFGMPYGIAIAAGAIAIYPQLHWFKAFGA